MLSLKSAALIALGAVIALLLAGCIFSPDTKRPTQPSGYLAYSSPENVITNMTRLYNNRDFTEYGNALASDYVFRFAPVDIIVGQPDSLVLADELTFAENLFHDGKPAANLEPASKITLVINTQTHGPDNRVGHSGWERYVVSTDLTLDFADGNSSRVTGTGYFYFKQEPAGSGTWKLAEWADQGGTLGKPLLASR
ncbi:MAG TPA: hypothetical protein VMS93_01735 [Candidatus Saccharimonadales bacterium]|nr:hypothetical protein [Candidatus Saccharimonadales bacterium]